MDALTLISKLAEHLAWPATACFSVAILKNDFWNSVKNIKRFRYKDTEIDFDKELSKAAYVAYENKGHIGIDKADNISNELAYLSPRGAIIESWLNIEESLRNFANKHGIEIDTNKPFRAKRAIEDSVKYKLLGEKTITLLETLRHLRNEAVHLKDSNINHLSAKEYQALSRYVTSAIDNA